MLESIIQRYRKAGFFYNLQYLKNVFMFIGLIFIFTLAVYIWKHYYDYKILGVHVLTPVYAFLIKHIVITSYWILKNIFSISLSCDIENSRLYFSQTSYIFIVKGCSGLREMSLFLFILIFFPGPWISKLWFIPVSLIIIYFITILRIVFLGLSFKYQPTWFDFLHEYLFNFIFFLLFFLLWLVWVKWFYKKKPVFLKSDLKPKED